MPTALTSPQVSKAAMPNKSVARIEPLDWTKGALVLFMVVYHAINYSVFRPLSFRYLSFLPPSFVMIAGLVVGSVYADRYDTRSWKPYVRLMIRGIKLLLIFVVLNLGLYIVRERDLIGGFMAFMDRAGMIFLSGNGRAGIFEVLLPIAYFLLLVPMLLWLRSRAAAVIPVCTLALFVLCVVLEKQGMYSLNLALLSAGTIGMAFGLIPIETIDRHARKWFPVLGAYVLYRLCGYYWGEIYAIQMFGAAVSVFLLYTCALHLNMSAWTGRQMILLGRYSLLGYLLQIGFLQVMVKVAGGKSEHWASVIAVGVLTSIFLFLAVNLVDFLRRRHRPVDLIYKGVFA
jgi:hypothetical protein